MVITHAKINGPPDLVVEILSPSTAKNDMAVKKNLHQREGVTEYWTVDRDARAVEQYRPVDGVFHQVPAAEPLRGLEGLVQFWQADAWSP